MIKSMTGFGAAKKAFTGYEIQVELRGVNHRYLETNFRTPFVYSFLNDYLRNLIQKTVFRGKIDVSVFINTDATLIRKVSADINLAKAYMDAILEVADSLDLNKAVDLSFIMGQKDVLKAEDPSEEKNEEILAMVLEVTQMALADFNEMRSKEGANLKKDMFLSLEMMENTVDEVSKTYDETLKAYEQRLYLRIEKLVSDLNMGAMSEDRILTELAIFADKISVNEEIIRLKSHISQMKFFLEGDSPIGKKIDFLTQEMNREVNTIGSKSQNAETSKLVVDLKSETEKIREQVQNIE